MGIERRRPVAAVESMVEALRGLYAGEKVDVDSESFGFREARLEYGRADMEIILAGRGPRMTDLGGRLADGFVLSWVHRDLLDDHATSLRLAAKAHGRRFTIVWSTMLVTTDADLWMARESLSFRLPDSPAAVKDMIGMTEGDTVAIRDALRQGGPPAAAHLVREEWVPHFVLMGSPEAVADEMLATMARCGIDEFQLPSLPAAAGAEAAATSIRRTAEIFGAEVAC
jgi:5,10-methylenetetrahydromethanopterin reductase